MSKLALLTATLLGAAMLAAAGCGGGAAYRHVDDGDLKALETSWRAATRGAAPDLTSQACRSGRLDSLRLLVEQGAPFQEGGGIASALFVCVAHGRADMVDYLLSKGAVVSDRDIRTAARYPGIRSALEAHLAAAGRAPERRGPAPSAEKLHQAAKKGDVAKLAALLDAGGDVDAALPKDPRDVMTGGKTPLMAAAHAGEHDAVKLLLDRGARIDAKSDWGWTAVTYASHYHAPQRVKDLLADAWRRAKGTDGVAARAEAPRKSTDLDEAVASDLAARPSAPSARALHKAVLEDSSSRVAAELDKGVPVDAFQDGLTPLMSAAMNGSAGMVRLLLQRGADPHLASQYKKRTALEGMQFTSRDRSEEEKREIAALLREAMGLSSPARRAQPGNLDDAAYDRMRAAAGMAPERRGPVSDVDSPSRMGAERPDDFALVIGVEGYQSLPKADHGERDAQTVRKHLEALGFPARNIVSLEGSGATKSKLESYLKEWLPLNVKPSSTLFVYYSGHGAPDPKSGDAYLVPWDGDPKFLKSTAYPLKALYEDLSKTKAKRVIVALDACFSGAGGRSVLAQGARPLVAKVAEIAAGERVTVLAAASGDEITGTLEEQGHGLFTYHLLKGLSANPKASAKALHGYLLPKVQDDARRQNREQTPTLAGASLDAPLLP